MKMSEVNALIDRFEQSDKLGTLELTMGGDVLKLEKRGGALHGTEDSCVPPDLGKEAAPMEEGSLVRAPLVGTFYAGPAPEKPAFVRVGQRVRAGEPLCVLEAMKMMSEVPAAQDCVILEILAENGALVGFDEPLFRVREL